MEKIQLKAEKRDIFRKKLKEARKRAVKSLKRRLYFFNHLIDPVCFPISDPPQTLTIAKKYRTGEIVPPIKINFNILNKMLATINSYYGIFRFANSYKLRKLLYKKHFRSLKKYFKPQNSSFQVIRIRKFYKNFICDN
ncbi:hypothetical protein KKA27_03985 [Patescibacteria group bacterium]|nr:hypothetical protein [Patescibacteria group bacterium]